MRQKCLMLQASKIIICISHQLSVNHIKRRSTFIARSFVMTVNRFIGNASLLCVDRREEESPGIKVVWEDLKVVETIIRLSNLLEHLTPKEEG